MKATTRRAWRRDLRALREECPPLLPVRVRLLEEPSPNFGWTSLSRDLTCFNVTISARHVEHGGRVRAATRQELLDTLIHEWAHCLAWTATHPLEAHDASWGVAYARCYQTTCED